MTLLNEMKANYDRKNHVRKEMTALKKEYLARFGIDLTAIEGFAAVEEVILARNHCIHRSDGTLEVYKKKTKQRLLDDSGLEIGFNPGVLHEVIGELQQFSIAMADRLNAFWKEQNKLTGKTSATKHEKRGHSDEQTPSI